MKIEINRFILGRAFLITTRKTSIYCQSKNHHQESKILSPPVTHKLEHVISDLSNIFSFHSNLFVEKNEDCCYDRGLDMSAC